MQHYLSDLHHGRVDPKQLQQRYAVARPTTFNPATVLQQALASGQLDDALTAAAPALPQYAALRAALARYRALDGHPAWQQPLPPLPNPARALRGRAATLTPGPYPGPYPGASRLAQRLQTLGDLPAGAWRASADPRYDGALVHALRSVQRRHGLADDGVVGAATLAALQVPPAARAQQISLALERLRWTPLLQGPRLVLINIPEFVLRAYAVVDNQIQLRTQMKVIVGKALDTRTPLFDETLRFIEFSPYWNVPPSIARAETVPRLRRDPACWAKEGFEFVATEGSVHTGLSAAGLDAVLAGRWRVRQRPGPNNALGDIKFVFPNRDNIVLHHTPATALFARTRRDFSHGCIRVEDPLALASFVLQGQHTGGPWTQDRIRAAMAQGRSSTLRLDATLPVLITYRTTLVLDGQLHFFDDLDGQDRVLDAALRQPRPALPAASRLTPCETSHDATSSPDPTPPISAPRRAPGCGHRGFVGAGQRAGNGRGGRLAGASCAGACGKRPCAVTGPHPRRRATAPGVCRERRRPARSPGPWALGQLNHFLRDHDSGQVDVIEPPLFDLLHRVRQLLGTGSAFEVISGDRCAATNQRLRQKGGGGVARHSLHMDGRAIDVRLRGVPLADLRDAALSLRAGGVGCYPRDQFVHLDTGRPRSW